MLEQIVLWICLAIGGVYWGAVLLIGLPVSLIITFKSGDVISIIGAITFLVLLVLGIVTLFMVL